MSVDQTTIVVSTPPSPPTRPWNDGKGVSGGCILRDAKNTYWLVVNAPTGNKCLVSLGPGHVVHQLDHSNGRTLHESDLPPHLGPLVPIPSLTITDPTL